MKPVKGKILVVEDESLVALDIREALRAFDYQVVAIAASGDEALRQAEKHRPDLVCMDIQLKGEMDGIETANLMRNRFNIPSIFLTAFTDQTLLGRAKLAQPYGYIVKPFEDRSLLATVETALYKHRQETLFLKNRDWFATLLSSLEDGIILVDLYANVVFMNAAARDLTGWRGNDAPPLSQVFPGCGGAAGEAANALILKALTEGVTATLDSTPGLRGNDGRHIQIEGAISPIMKPDGLILGAILVFQQVKPATPPLAAPVELAAAEDGLILIDPQANIIFMNVAAKNMTGWREDAVNCPLKTVLSSRGPKTVESLAGKALADGETAILTPPNWVLPKDGGNLSIEGSLAPIMKPGGAVLGAILAFQTVAALEGKAMHSALPSSHNNPENLITVSPAGTITSFNRGAERVFGFKSSEVVGKDIESLLPKPFQAVIRNDGTFCPLHQAIKHMRIKERGLFIGLLYNLFQRAGAKV